MEHLATIDLMPDPSDPAGNTGQLEVELLRDKTILLIQTPEQQSFQLSPNGVEKLIQALQRAADTFKAG